MSADGGAPESSATPGSSGDDERLVDREVLPVVIRSTPRYGRFLWFGVAGGLLIAVVLTWIASLTEQPGGPLSTGPSGLLLVFTVYAAAAVGVGLVVMGVLAMVLARVASGRARPASAEHDTTLVMDLAPPVNDDVPRWVIDSEDLAPGERRGGPGAPRAPRRPRA